jgi:hypothetical protein
MKTNPLFLLLALCLPASTLAQYNHGAQMPYAGMQNRDIKSFSDNDIKELRRGGGWGLALAANSTKCQVLPICWSARIKSR